MDQDKPYEENNIPPVETNPVPPPTPASRVEPAVPPTEPTVVVPANGGAIPKWFYFIFGLTAVAFFLVTGLIVLQLTQKQPGISNLGPTVAPKVTGTLPTPTLSSTGATDSAVAKLDDVKGADDLVSIDADLKNTDLTVIDQRANEVDAAANSSF